MFLFNQFPEPSIRMKLFCLRLWVMWRRFRLGGRGRHEYRLHYENQIASLLSRADPLASWPERANWMVDVADWLRREPRISLLDAGAQRRIRTHRLRSLLDWLDNNRDARKLVRLTLQKTLREASGPELFCVTGLPRELAFFSELIERVLKLVLPRPMSKNDLSTLFSAMFPHADDAAWLLELDRSVLTRLAKLCADDGIVHAYMKQIDEALNYLVSMVVAAGVSHEFHRRLEPKTPLQATPFMALRRELEKYFASPAGDQSALRSVRMLIAVCQAQTDRVYEHLDEYGVSVSLVYSIERMRAQLARMGRLIDLRAGMAPAVQGAAQMQILLADMIHANHRRSSVRALVRRSFSLLARKMVERNASHGEHYIARNREEYRAMFRSAYRGGILTAFTVLAKSTLLGAGLARFFEGLFASLNYAISFVAITSVGGVLATKQPAVTAPALAAKMGDLDSRAGLRALVTEIACLLRSQAAAVLGNIGAVIPAMLVLASAIYLVSGAPVLSAAKAQASIQSLSLLGPTPLYAALTGVLLWLASLAAGFADNWFALRQLRSALAHHRRLVHALGAARAERLAHWVENNVSSFVGNVSLGVLLGMGPVLAQFFGLPLDVRHVTLSTGTLTAAVASLGGETLATPAFWLAVGGIVVMALLNVGVAFACSLALALRAREVPGRIRRLVLRSVLRRFAGAPLFFLLPREEEVTPLPDLVPVAEEQEESMKTGT